MSFLHISAQTQLFTRAGFNFSTAKAVFGDGKRQVDYVPGGHIGIQLRTTFEGLLHFSAIVAYNSRGFVIHSKTNDDKTRNFIHYLDLLPQLSIDIPTGNKRKLVFSAGPSASLAIGGREKTTAGNLTSTSRMKFSTVNEYGLFDFGLNVSVGYHFNKLFIEAAYQYSFVNINNNVETDKRNIQNRNFSLALGYRIRSFK